MEKKQLCLKQQKLQERQCILAYLPFSHPGPLPPPCLEEKHQNACFDITLSWQYPSLWERCWSIVLKKELHDCFLQNSLVWCHPVLWLSTELFCENASGAPEWGRFSVAVHNTEKSFGKLLLRQHKNFQLVESVLHQTISKFTGLSSFTSQDHAGALRW